MFVSLRTVVIPVGLLQNTSGILDGKINKRTATNMAGTPSFTNLNKIVETWLD